MIMIINALHYCNYVRDYMYIEDLAYTRGHFI